MIMPVFNEVATIGEIIERVRKAPIHAQLELVVVDDSSTDGTRQLLSLYAAGSEDIRLDLQERNQGKGAAIGKASSTRRARWPSSRTPTSSTILGTTRRC